VKTDTTANQGLQDYRVGLESQGPPVLWALLDLKAFLYQEKRESMVSTKLIEQCKFEVLFILDIITYFF
jgi:hypothetical protein